MGERHDVIRIVGGWWCQSHNRWLDTCERHIPEQRPACTCELEWVFGGKVDAASHVDACPVSRWVDLGTLAPR